MRQRKAKDLEKRLLECSEYMVEPGKTADAFAREDEDGVAGSREAETFVEIGCGKGDFIIAKALGNPHSNFIAMEGQETVILRALEKAKDALPPDSNLKFVPAFVDRMEDFFDENQLDGIYLNFSDPWPKTRHAKRRLTHRDRLVDYGWALRPGGFIEFKTDNDDLFDFTLGEIRAVGYEITELTRDLHSSEYEARLIMTEYEAKFSRLGKNINYVRMITGTLER